MRVRMTIALDVDVATEEESWAVEDRIDRALDEGVPQEALGLFFEDHGETLTVANALLIGVEDL